MSRDGYAARLALCFGGGPEHDEPEHSLTPESAAEEQAALAKRLLPPAWLTRAALLPSTLPTVYHTYKGKCLLPTGGGLACAKSHAHEREICANFSHPLRAPLSLASRALRLAKRLAHEPGWTLWRQADLTPELHRRLSLLQDFPSYASRCPCGAAKCSPLSVAKVDASQFFKGADPRRAYRRATRFFRRLTRDTGFDAVAVRRSQRAQGFLCSQQRKPSQEFRIVSVQDILRALAFSGADNLCLLGGRVIRRVRGWPMGGAMSEPATLVDLGEDTLRLYSDPSTQRASGLLWPGVPIAAVVQGLQHVGDALLASRIWCVACLHRGLQRVWPSDCGTSLEESGPVLRFLQAVVVVSPSGAVAVRPSFTNAPFAKGEALHPAKATLVPYMGPHVSSKSALRCYLFSKLLAFGVVATGQQHT